jgi:hypothetical protein
MEIKNEIVEKWWVAYNESKSIIHYGKTEIGQVTVSGQPLFEIFDNELDYSKRLTDLGVNLDI